MRFSFFLLFILLAFTITVFVTPRVKAVDGGVLENKGEDLMMEKPSDYPVAIFAGGCFWCLESEFRALDGVLYTRVGYSGGQTEKPTYQDISTGQTGHAEAVEITFDPEQITYKELVEFFLLKGHDPTQLNRQGVDVGTQYRSEIFYHDEEQRVIAEEAFSRINRQGVYNKPIATRLSAAPVFWLAEGYHQQYYEKYEEQKGAVHPRVIYKKKMKLSK